MKVSKLDALKYAKAFHINLNVVPFDQWFEGMNIELEHGTKFKKYLKKTNVTNNDLKKTAMIVIAHLLEAPDYYKDLKKMEHKLEKRWEGKKKPNIFNN